MMKKLKKICINGLKYYLFCVTKFKVTRGNVAIYVKYDHEDEPNQAETVNERNRWYWGPVKPNLSSSFPLLKLINFQ